MKRMYALLACAALVAAVAAPAQAADINFGTVQAGQHVEIAAGATKSFSFTTPAGTIESDVVFSDDPKTNDRCARLTIKINKGTALLATRPMNYCRVRSETFSTVAGDSYVVTVTSEQDIAFAVTMKYGKPKVATVSTRPPPTTPPAPPRTR